MKNELLFPRREKMSPPTSMNESRVAGARLLRRATLAMALIANLLCHPADAQQKASSAAVQPLSVERNAQDNTPVSMSFPAGTKWNKTEAKSFFNKVLNISNKNVSLVEGRNVVTKQGTAVTRYDQYYKGIKVHGGNYALMTKDNAVTFMNGNYYDIKADIPATTKISEATALNKALSTVSAEKYMWQIEGMERNIKQQNKDPKATFYPKAEFVWIEDHELTARNRQLHLAYAFNIYAMKPLARKMVYVDANTGKVLFVNNLLHHTAATGVSKYSGTVNIEAAMSGGSYVLHDNTRGGGIYTYSLNNTDGSVESNITDISSASTSFASNIAVDAHWGAEKVYDYWNTVHGRNSFDGAGTALYSYVNFMTDYDNAFWDGYEMVYGDGSGASSGGFDPLASLDVCAHEIGHAVCQYTANLDYEKESGAMNEGFSDIWGAVIENYADPHESDAKAKNMWKIGEEIATSPLRSMDNPNLQFQPDTYAGTYWFNLTSCSPSDANDQCGVHYNSGVLNHWFYRLTLGGTGTNDIGNVFSVTGVGATKAALIAYNTELLLTNSSNFANCRTASISAATTLYGACSPEVTAVTNAWYAVGVGAAFSGSLSAISGSSSVCIGSTITLTNSTTGGTWSSSSTATATVGSSSGIVTGVAAGTVTISYTSSSCTATKIVTVTGAPAAISGTASACPGSTSTLANATSGGTWSSSNTGIASVGSATGIVTGVATGTATITYSTGGSCRATAVFTVNAVPSSIGGTAVACVGATTTLTNPTPAGTWSSNNTSIASVGSSTGIVTGVAAGTTTITYTVTATGCYKTATVTINALPGAVSGTGVCLGGTTTLSTTPTGGTWTSSAPSTASIGASTGIVTGVANGTATISYTISTGCRVTSVVTVSAIAASTGVFTVCAGSATTLSNAITGGTWTSSTASVATVGSSTGVVTGVAAGTSTITYVAATGCKVTSVVTVNALPNVITGTMSVCEGAATTLASTTTGGAWSTSSMSTATVGTSGIVSGVAAGTVGITYTSALGCARGATVTVNAAPAAITGTASMCAGTTTTLSNSVAGGTWTSSNTTVATIGTSGVVTGNSAGTALISYTMAGGCRVTKAVTVNALPAAITGTASVCTGLNTTLADATTGGTWASADAAIASIGTATSGVVTGVMAGTVGITYTLSTGCARSTVVTVNTSPDVITGTASACVGQSSSLANTVTGGTWTSANTSVATIGSATGVVNALIAGTSSITYTVTGGCKVTKTFTVNGLPAAIGGTASVCEGSTTTLTDGTAGGSWTSGTMSVATIGTNGVVTGVMAGTALMSYTLSTGCQVTKIVTVNAIPAEITGTATLCPASTTTLSDATTGGTWSSSTPGVASINASTGIVTGVAAGTTRITYTITATGCKNTTLVTVNPYPAVIGGTAKVCVGLATTLTDATTGGSWSISGMSTATIDASTGVATGVAAGTTTVTYTLGTGCYKTIVLTVNALPKNINGNLNVCVGSTTALTDSTTGALSWTSSNTAVATVVSTSGVVTGVAAGTANITYTLNTGCITTAVVTVNPLPAAFAGTRKVCVGLTTTLSDTTGGSGTWTSSNATIATVGSTSGVVTGNASGTTTITYTLPTGCRITGVVTVNPLPASIGGTTSVCVGTTTALTDATGGGSWSSSNTMVGTVGTTGIVTGLSAGTTVITYTITTGCYSVTTVTVLAQPGSIAGTLSACAGSTSSLTNATTGGTWSSSNTTVATVGTSGVVTANAAGTTTITYSTGFGCRATASFTINATPAAIAGTTTICKGLTSALTDATTGGTWMSDNTMVATVGTSGVVTGVDTGTAGITYTLATGCYRATTVTIKDAPTTIGGTTTVCVGSLATLTNSVSGGSWTSSTPSVATVDATTGVMTGAIAGTAIMTYSIGTGCRTTTTVTVYAVPAAITGTASVCEGGTTTLADATTGGTWSSSMTSVATVGTSGVVTGSIAGTTTIAYTNAAGCAASRVVTVFAAPAAITGTLSVCSGSTTTLDNSVMGGAWSSANSAVATVGSSTGVVSGVAAGTVRISYTIGTCSSTAIVTVNATPSAITGSTSLCVGATGTLADATAGGSWSSSDMDVATIGTNGVVSAMDAGTTTISYVLSSGCYTTTVVTVTSSPGSISGPAAVCRYSTTALGAPVAGGTWSSSDEMAATIDSAGNVTALTASEATLTYSLGGGCATIHHITIIDAPQAITGTASVCVGSTTTLANATADGTWSSGMMSVATVDAATGVVTGGIAGTVAITYTIGTSCDATKIVTVNALPSAISGTLSICSGFTSTLTNMSTGGVWSSSDASVASVGSSTGVVTAGMAGTATITYTAGVGCMITAEVTVNAAADPITGTALTCVGSTTSLTDGDMTGTWSSSNSAVATVGSSTGVVTGVAAGTASIIYTPMTGCAATVVATVSAAPATIGGTRTVCVGATNTLTNAVTGGVWTSSNMSVATVGSSTGIYTGVGVGIATITYTTGGGCSVTAAVTVNASTAITGSSSVCMGATTTLANGTSGGTWTSSNGSVATIGTNGVITTVGAGTTNISYTLASGCYAAIVFTVNALPATIGGSGTVCVGSTITLTDATTPGTWASALPGTASVGSASGIVTGNLAGTTTVTYTASTGCKATTIVTVTAGAPSITGNTALCVGNTITLGNTSTGGTWSTSNSGIADVGSSTGIVSGMGAGTATVDYTTTSGCTKTVVVTVNSLPATISGSSTVCIGSTTTLTNGVTGGVWSSTATTIVSVGSSSGVVTGLAAGTANITYTTGTGCRTTAVMTVNSAPATIGGTLKACPGTTTTLTDATTGGTWNTTATTIGTVDAMSGVVTGVSAGTMVVTYTSGASCTRTTVVTINPNPASIAGTLSTCVGATTALSNPTSGGLSWSSSNTAVATVGASSGLVSGVSAGTSKITYTLGTGCIAVSEVTVNALPATFTGTMKACVGLTSALSTTPTGGTWTSTNMAVATVGSSSGTVTGVAAGTSTITYTSTGGCVRTGVFTVNTLPTAITGYTTACVGTTTTLASTGTGTWSVSSTDTATVGSTTGIVTGVGAGTTTVSFTLSTGCYATTTVTVQPALPAIGGTASVCSGFTTTLTNSVSGGTWSSGNAAIGTVGTSGVVTGIGASGTVNISYSFGTGCKVVKVVTVNLVPAAITGTTSVCAGSTTTLNSGTSGGTWTSSNMTTATIGSSNHILSALVAGTTTISYTLSSGCARAVDVTVNASPTAGTISADNGFLINTMSMPTSTTFSTSGTSGGTWTSSNTAVATVGSSDGLVSAVGSGTSNITYTVTTGSCSATVSHTIMVLVARPGATAAGNEEPSTFAVYPNPTRGVVHIDASDAGTFHVFAVDGKEVSNFSIVKGANTVTLPSQIAAGVYMCRFIAENGNTAVVRLVVE